MLGIYRITYQSAYSDYVPSQHHYFATQHANPHPDCLKRAKKTVYTGSAYMAADCRLDVKGFRTFDDPVSRVTASPSAPSES